MTKCVYEKIYNKIIRMREGEDFYDGYRGMDTEENLWKTGGEQEMKSLREIKAILLGCFYGGMFVAQMIGWLIVNYMGDCK